VSGRAANPVARDATIQGTLVSGVLNMDFKTVLQQSGVAKWQRNWDHIKGDKL
jgi:hypothetical protein